jgi:hypothetical protein
MIISIDIVIIIGIIIIVIITIISDIIIPHGSALFTKMASMDPSRQFSVPAPSLNLVPQSLVVQIPSLQGRRITTIITTIFIFTSFSFQWLLQILL